MNLEELHSKAYDRYLYPNAFPTIDVGGAVGQVSADTVTTDELYGFGKGVVQSELSLPDFVESLAMGVYDMIRNPEKRGRLQSFIDGFHKEGIAPNLEQIKEMMSGFLPEPSTASGKEAQEYGELAAPGTLVPAVYKAGKKVLRKKSGAIIAPTVNVDEKANK